MQKAILIGRGYWGKILQGYIQKHYEISHIFGSDVKDEVLKNALSKVDSAFIATPLSSHFKLSKLALEHNCNVFVEKPSTATKEEFEILLNLAKKNNKILFTDYIYTFSRSILYALQMLQGKHIESIQAEITQYGNFYENESVLEVIGVHYISVFAFMQELGLLHNLCVKECKFLDSKKQSATLELSALQNRENGDRKITLSLHCSLLSNDKKRLLCIRTTDSTICVDMLSQTPLSLIESSKSLPIFDEKNNLNFALQSFVDMCAKMKQDSRILEPNTKDSPAEVSLDNFVGCEDFCARSYLVGSAEAQKANSRKSVKETPQNLHLRFSHTTLNLLSQAHNLAQVSTPKP